MKGLTFFFSFLYLSLASVSARPASVADSLFSQQWHLKNDGQLILRSSGELTRERLVGVPGADINWLPPSEYKEKIPADDKNIVVAILDTGIDLHHPDLKGRLWVDSSRCEAGQVHDLENPCHGFNFIEMNSNIADDLGHGTHVAGLIAANLNEIGISGVSDRKIKIMPVKVVNASTQDFVQNGRMITDIFADGIRYAVQNGADVINISLGWPKLVETPKVRIAITKAIESGIAIIAAAGNNGKDIPTFPCTYEGVICVGAMDNQGKITEYSNFGGKVDLVAPGENIISTFPSNLESRALGIQGYEVKQGTSQAAPLVSAVAATIKLLNPKISLKELQAKILSSSLKHPRFKNLKERRVRFGALNMKGALEATPKVFVAPSFKDILTIHVDHKQQFEFSLPLISYVGDASDIKVKVRVKSEDISLDQSDYKIPQISSTRNEVLKIKGKVLDLNAESGSELEVEVYVAGEIVTQTSTLISFARDLEVVEKITYEIPGVDHRLVSHYSADRKSSRLVRVLDRFSLLGAPEFSYVDPRKISAESYTVSLLQLRGERYRSLDLKLPALAQVLKVFAMDYNRDGSVDYMVYALAADKKNLVLSFFNQDGEPLYGELSHWFWPITTFEGLPQQGDSEDFEYFTVELPGVGEVLSPAMNKTWELPAEDNTTHILDRLPSENVEHIYYLKPELQSGKVTLSVRALTGWNFISDFKERYSLYGDEVINFSKPLRQSFHEAKKGILRVPLAFGSEASKRHLLIEFTKKGVSQKPISGAPLLIEDNNRFPIESLMTKETQREHLLFALAGRTTGRVSRLGHSGNLSPGFTMKRESWGDPFFSIIGSFKNDEDYWYFMESRYKVIAYSEGGASFELPLNRDSSFPGVQFSETLKTTKIKAGDAFLPGVVVDSTLVYGDRIYTMVAQSDKFVRPIGLSLETSAACIPSGVGVLAETPTMIYLCRDHLLNMRFEMVPLLFGAR